MVIRTKNLLRTLVLCSMAVAVSAPATPPTAAAPATDDGATPTTHKETWSGRATALDGGAHVFTRRTVETWRNGTVIAAKSTAESPSGEVLLRADVKASSIPTLPAHTIDFPRTGMLMSSRPVAGGVEIAYREKRGEETARKVVKPVGLAVNGAGMPALMMRSFEALAAGKTVNFSLVAPSRMEWYRFRATGKGKRTIGGKPHVVVDVNPDSRFLRMFAGTMTFYLDAQTRRIMRYEGIANVRDGEGDRYKVRLAYR